LLPASLAVTTRPVKTGPGESALAAGEKAGDAWQVIRADPQIQFAPVTLPEAPQQPGWLERLFEFLAGLFAPAARFITDNWPVIWPVLAIMAGLLVLYWLYTVLAPTLLRQGRKAQGAEEQWSSDAAEALALLEDADRLAAEGRYDEATHLLLIRSVGQIREARPELVEPSSTAREIASLSALPDAARQAFAAIAAGVEKSLFAHRRLSAEDWQAARTAYADFALAAEHRLAA
jgi:hypothetical protein